MVLQRRLYYGFSGYEVPVVPRASRSARGKVPIRKTREDNPVRAFEILASIAGELLQDTDSSAPNITCGDDQSYNVELEKENERKLLKTVPPEQETFEENSFPYVHGLRGHHQTYTVKELSHADKIFSFDINTISKNFDQPEKICFTDKFPYESGRNASGSYFATVSGEFPRSREFLRGHVISAIETNSKAELLINQSRRSEKIYFATKWSSFNSRNACRGPSGNVCGESPRSRVLVKGCLDTEEQCRKPPAPVSSDSNLRASLFRGWKTFGCFSKYFADIEVASGDDDETSFRCSQPGTMVTAYKPSPNVVHRGSGNLSVSRHWITAPKMKDWKRKPVYFNGRFYKTHQRSQRISPTKRRKLFNRIPLSTSDGGFHYKDIFSSLDNGSNGDNSHRAKEAASLAGSQQAPPEPSRDCNVKLSIKSLKVPELLIEIPATATVGSLKRVVMEAVTAVLGDGLHVGVRLQGKAVRDDSKTLLQTGICHGDKHHRLGFVLEPKHVHIAPPPCSDDCPLLSDGTGQWLTGHMMSMYVQPVPSDVITPLPQLMKTDGFVGNYSTAVHSSDDIFINNTRPNSQALVAVPAVATEALAVVPFHKKSKHHEFVQRRARRPFSVLEVEALVQAVEKLGTGRWRDVKLCAFDSAKHRTYVDLKDKWKTLVHTARISPRQRRGEPVPQQLLDRVLAAHAFWSQQQAQPQVKVAV